MMRVADTIREKLTVRFTPTQLEIIDESHRHAGHAGARLEGETHFSVTIVSAIFIGESRVSRQRLVYQTLAEELATRAHVFRHAHAESPWTLPSVASILTSRFASQHGVVKRDSVLADSEHYTAELIDAVHLQTPFELLVPMPQPASKRPATTSLPCDETLDTGNPGIWA